MIQLSLAVVAFVGGHFLLSSPPVRGPVVARAQPAFSGISSTQPSLLAALIWMVRAFRGASFIPLWSVPPDARDGRPAFVRGHRHPGVRRHARHRCQAARAIRPGSPGWLRKPRTYRWQP